MVERVADRPETIVVNGLDSLVKLIRVELDKLPATPVFIRVCDNRCVQVFSTYGDAYKRDFLYDARCDVPEFRPGIRTHEAAIIELRSGFIESEGSQYLLDLLARVSVEASATSEDNGVTQEVTARTGVALAAKVPVKPRISLRPYRTFLEVEQPESEFLLRLDGGGNVNLIEADGGMWKMVAKRSIADYFASALAKQIEAGKVVVMM